MWTICFTVSFGFCSYSVFQSISNYFSFEVVSHIDYIVEAPVQFPAVTFCNINQLSSKVAQDLVEDKLKQLGFNRSSAYTPNYMDFDNFELASYLVTFNVTSPDFGDENRKKIITDDLITICDYGGINCGPSDWIWIFDKNWGNCYRFNSTKKKEINKAGTGLTFGILLGNNENKYSVSLFNGLKVFIHNSSLEPTESNSLNLKPSEFLDIQVKRTFISQEPYPYSDCIDLSRFSSVYFEHFKKLNRAYRQSDCFDLCLQNRIVDSCRCYDVRYLNMFNSKPCLANEDFLCSESQYDLFITNGTADCSVLCPKECETIQYDFTLSSLDYPSLTLYSLYKDLLSLSFEETKSRLIGFNIYYSTLGYTKISESPKTLVIDLFSNIGGTLGLCIGISLLSLIEMVEILLEICFILIRK